MGSGVVGGVVIFEYCLEARVLQFHRSGVRGPGGRPLFRVMGYSSSKCVIPLQGQLTIGIGLVKKL